jgi:hypothetical protein
MKLSAAFLRRLHWINLPGALLLTLLQRTPVLRVAAPAGELVHPSPVGQVLRSAFAAVAALGALHTLAGATALSVSSGAASGVTGAAGSQLGPIALGTIGTLGQPLSWQISGVMPAGLAFQSSSGARLTSGGTLNTPSGVMLLAGTPTAAGTYPLTLIAYQGNNRTLIASPAFTYNIVITEGTLALPTFTTQPANQTVNAGSTATFSVVATGSPTFQWRKDGAPLSGATAATLTLSAVTSAQAGTYAVVATNAAGTATSTNATLTLNPTPAAVVITTQPVSQFSVVGQSVSFTVVATGNPSPTYQWLKNSTPLAGAVNATLTLANLTLADAGNYRLRHQYLRHGHQRRRHPQRRRRGGRPRPHDPVARRPEPPRRPVPRAQRRRHRLRLVLPVAPRDRLRHRQPPGRHRLKPHPAAPHRRRRRGLLLRRDESRRVRRLQRLHRQRRRGLRQPRPPD